VGNNIKRLSQGHSDALPHRESNQGFATFRLLVRRHCLFNCLFKYCLLFVVSISAVSQVNIAIFVDVEPVVSHLHTE